MRNRAELREAPVRSDENSSVCLCGGPQIGVLQSLIRRSADVAHIVSEFPQTLLSFAGYSRRREFAFLSQAGGIVETRHDVLACYRRILRQQIFDGVAICQHSNDLVDRDPCAFDTCLPVTDSRAVHVR